MSSQLGSTQHTRNDLLPGTLVLLLLKALALGPGHSQTISRRIRQVSENAFRESHGSLYPALRRIEREGWVRSRWKTQERHRVRHYRLTPAGLRQLELEAAEWERLSAGVGKILNTN